MHTKIDFTQYQYESSAKQTSNPFPITTKPQFINQNSKTNKYKKKNHQLNLYQKITQLKSILEWRKTNIAPVDTMGCQRLADINAPIQIQKYQTLISLMLSVQTKDQITSMVVQRLKNYGLTPDKIVMIPTNSLIQMIRQSNFNKRKAANIQEVSRMIIQKGRIARTTQQLMQYPGVGVKIAMIYMNVVQQKQQGIGVDTHVHRISNRLGWVASKTPNQTEQLLQKCFDKKYWKQMNIGLVGFGQLCCKAVKPLCNNCPISNTCISYLKF